MFIVYLLPPLEIETFLTTDCSPGLHWPDRQTAVSDPKTVVAVAIESEMYVICIVGF